MSEYCPFCMHAVNSGEICKKCGNDPKSYVPSSHHFPPNTLLKDRYLIGRVLGEGGFGITYLGRDMNLDRRVAVKEYFPTSFVKRETSVGLDVTCYTNAGQDYYEKGRDRFLSEARTMAKLDNIPEVVNVLDFFPANNTAYIVMEFLEGDTLKTIVEKQGRIPSKTLFDMLEPVLKAMQSMHSAGIIHRDISPDNLMQLKNGNVKLMDFGCARDIEGGRTMTVTLKHGFAPIEQYTGKNQGPWSDIYSLCATIYYCLTGKIPPRSVERADDEQDTLIPPSKLGAALTPSQEQAIIKGLAVKARDRWQSVSDFYSNLYSVTMQGFPYVPPERSDGNTVGKTEFISAADIPKDTAAVAAAVREPTASENENKTVHTDNESTAARSQDENKKKKLLPFILSGAGVFACAAIAVAAVLIINNNEPAAETSVSGNNTASSSVTDDEDPTSTPSDEPAIVITKPAKTDPPAAEPQQPASSAAADYEYTVLPTGVTVDKYVGSGKDVVIPDMIEDVAVIKIGERAFSGRTDITSVTMPKYLTVIDKDAFGGCSSLKNVMLNDSLRTIGVRAFQGNAFSQITIPDSVTTINDYAFHSCENLKTINIPKKVSRISGTVFNVCSSLTDITVDSENKSMCTVDHMLFSSDKTVLISYPRGRKDKSVAVPEGTNEIDDSAFFRTYAVEKVTLPSSLKKIGDNCFDQCTALKNINIPKSLKDIPLCAFRGCENLEKIDLPDGVKSIETSSFDGCPKVKITYKGKTYGYTELKALKEAVR